jgi:hypothetical protein
MEISFSQPEDRKVTVENSAQKKDLALMSPISNNTGSFNHEKQDTQSLVSSTIQNSNAKLQEQVEEIKEVEMIKASQEVPVVFAKMIEEIVIEKVQTSSEEEDSDSKSESDNESSYGPKTQMSNNSIEK